MKAIKEEVMNFLNEIYKKNEFKLVYHGVIYELKEVKELINERTKLGESLYEKIEILYNAMHGGLKH